MARVRSKHSNLLNYFIHDRRDLSPAYVRKCEKFLHSLRNTLIKKKDAAALFKLQATSTKRQAPSATEKTQLNSKIKLERKDMYTLAQILEAWTAAYGEDMHEEYPGFIQRLQEEKNES